MIGGRAAAIRLGLAISLWLVSVAVCLKVSFFPGIALFGGGCLVMAIGCAVAPTRRGTWINIGGISAVLLLAELACCIFLNGGRRAVPLGGTLSGQGAQGLQVRRVKDPALLNVPPRNHEWTPDDSWIRLRELGDAAVYWYPEVLDATENGFLQLKPSSKARAVRVQNGAVRYDATYTSNAYGFRKTPAADPTKPTVAVFGCSFAFGRGLNDDETLPHAIALHSQRQLSAINFAMSGHAPNNALMLLDEQKERPSTAGINVVAGVYLTMWDHPRRVLGERFWTQGYPRYVLRGDVPVRDGVFTRALAYRPGMWEGREKVLHNLRKMAFLDVLIDSGIRQDFALANAIFNARARRNLKLYAAILKQVASTFEARYHAPFVVVAWLRDTPDERAIYQSLEKYGLRVIDLADLVSGKDDLLTIPHDGHPNALANGLIADRVLAYLRDLKVISGHSAETSVKSVH